MVRRRSSRAVGFTSAEDAVSRFAGGAAGPMAASRFLSVLMKFLPPLPRTIERLLGEVERSPVVALQDEEPHHERVPFREGVLQQDDVAERLPHLLAADRDEVVVDPVLHERFPGEAFALGDLALVVGEHVVHPAAVDVERLSQVLHRHRRALDVPSREPRSPTGSATA